jgi:hypothetical protein
VRVLAGKRRAVRTHRRLAQAVTWVTTASPRIPASASPRVTITIHMTCTATSLARSRLHQLSAHAGQGPALQAGDVHLGEADPGRDGVLVQLMEEPENDDLALQLRQS